jgi:hypothetical protein
MRNCQYKPFDYITVVAQLQTLTKITINTNVTLKFNLYILVKYVIGFCTL